MQARKGGFNTKRKKEAQWRGRTTSPLQASQMFVWGGAEKQVKTNPLASHKKRACVKQGWLRERERVVLQLHLLS